MVHVEQMQRALYDLLPDFLPIASARAHLQQLKELRKVFTDGTNSHV